MEDYTHLKTVYLCPQSSRRPTAEKLLLKCMTVLNSSFPADLYERESCVCGFYASITVPICFVSRGLT